MTGQKSQNVTTAELQTTPSRQEPFAALSMTPSVKEKLLERISGYGDPLPAGVTPDWGTRIREIIFDKIEIPASDTRVITSEDAHALLNEAYGAVVKLKNELTQANSPADKEFRKSTMQWLEGLRVDFPKTVHQEQQKSGMQSGDVDLTQQIQAQAALNTESYIKWLKHNLDPQTKRFWNPFNVIGAMSELAFNHPSWMMRSDARVVASRLVAALDGAAEQSGWEMSEKSFRFLVSSLSTISKLFERQEQKDPEAESKLFRAAAKLSQSTIPDPSLRDLDKRFFWPLEGITSLYLSSDGAQALCQYADEVHQVSARSCGGQRIAAVEAGFKSLKNITCWHETPESQRHLCSILSNLTSRLEKASEPVTSEVIGNILSGLRGIEGDKLDVAGQYALAKTITTVTKKIEQLREVPSLKAFGLGIHGVSPFLGTSQEPLKTAMLGLVASFARKPPQSPVTMEELGFACGAVNSLLCHRDLFPGFVSQIWTQIIDPTDYRRFEMDRADLSNLVAWSVVQQGYYNYKKRMPQALSHRLTSLEENATRFAHDQSSKSEYRVRKLLEAIDGITVQSKMIRHGFDQDIPFSVRGVRKSFVLEVDGALHAAPAQRLQDDASMSAHAAMGVTVVRVPSNATAEQVRAAIGRVVPAFTSPS